MIDRSSMNKRSSMIGWCSSNWVGSSSFIGNISNISFIPISLVVNMLGTTIRKSNRVRSSSITSTITSLSSIEVGVGVVISNSISVGVRRRLIRISRLSMVGGGGMDNRGVVGRGSMDNRGVVGRGSMDNRSMVGRGSMVDWGMSNNTSSTMKTVGRVSYSSNTGSKGLGLSGTSVFSLVWLGDRLVGHLASWTTMITTSKELWAS